MPFINVKMLEGRSEEQRRELVQVMTDAMVNICGAKPEGTTVVIENVARDHWAKGGVLMSDQGSSRKETTGNSDADLRDAILAADQDFMQTFRRGDAKAIAALYTSDGQLLPAHSDLVTGQRAIQEFWEAAIDSGIKTAQLDTLEVEGYGDTAIEVGKYRLGGEVEQVLDEGKYIVIWKWENGRWRLHRDIWNTSMPAPE